jgi:hypothetical protein
MAARDRGLSLLREGLKSTASSLAGFEAVEEGCFVLRGKFELASRFAER